MQSNISIWVLYKVITLSVGLLCTYMGYRLLLKGIFDGGSDITAAWNNNKKLIIKRASPGIIFALIGFGIITINFLVSGYSYQVISNPNTYNNINSDGKSGSSILDRAVSKKEDGLVQIYCLSPAQLEMTKIVTTPENATSNKPPKTHKEDRESPQIIISESSNQLLLPRSIPPDIGGESKKTDFNR